MLVRRILLIFSGDAAERVLSYAAILVLLI